MKVRATIKWLATALLIVVGLTTVLSGTYALDWRSQPQGLDATLWGGCIMFSKTPAAFRGPPPAWSQQTWRWRIVRSPLPLKGSFMLYSGGGQTHCTIPLWPLVFLLGVGVLWLWWLDDFRLRPGRCSRCEYDLRGLSTPTCPECGQEEGNARRGRLFGAFNATSVRVLKWSGLSICLLLAAFGVWSEAFEFMPQFERTAIAGGATRWSARIPFWMPFALVLLPTVWLWWRGSDLVPAD